MCIKNLYAIDVHNIFENINILPRILYYSHDLITYKKNINIRIFDEKVINKNYFPPTDCMSSKPTADVSENFFFTVVVDPFFGFISIDDDSTSNIYSTQCYILAIFP